MFGVTGPGCVNRVERRQVLAHAASMPPSGFSLTMTHVRLLVEAPGVHSPVDWNVTSDLQSRPLQLPVSVVLCRDEIPSHRRSTWSVYPRLDRTSEEMDLIQLRRQKRLPNKMPSKRSKVLAKTTKSPVQKLGPSKLQHIRKYWANSAFRR